MRPRSPLMSNRRISSSAERVSRCACVRYHSDLHVPVKSVSLILFTNGFVYVFHSKSAISTFISTGSHRVITGSIPLNRIVLSTLPRASML